MLDVAKVREQFPGLGRDAIFFDGPGGSQTPRCVVDGVSDYFLNKNSNSGGVFALCKESDERRRCDFVYFVAMMFKLIGTPSNNRFEVSSNKPKLCTRSSLANLAWFSSRCWAKSQVQPDL